MKVDLICSEKCYAFISRSSHFLGNFRATTQFANLSGLKYRQLKWLRMLDRLRTYAPAFYQQACQSFPVRVINGSFAFIRAHRGVAIVAIFAGESNTFRRHSSSASNSLTFCVEMPSRGPQPYYPCCSRRTHARCSRPHCCAQWSPPCVPSRCRDRT
jgi:hypothetical protein